MRKRILLSIIALCGYIGIVSAQEEHEYIPFVRDCEFGYYKYNWCRISSFFHYCIKDDVVIDGKNYKGFYYYIDSETTELIGYVREMDKKVYLRQGDTDWLWYDFSLQAGDVVSYIEGSPFGRGYEEITVENIDTLEFAGSLRTHVSLFVDHCWVEGIGDINFLPLDKFGQTPTCPCGVKMFYVKENGEFIYRKETFCEEPIDDPFLNDSGIDDIGMTTLHIAQHPNQWVVTLPSDDCRMVEVIDTSGRVAWCEYLDGNTDSIAISTASLARGIYIVTLTAESGERITRKIAL